MKIRNIHSHWRYTKGSTLIEVLIAAIVVGIGLLGIAALQLKALQGSSNAQYRSDATDIAWMISDRIRANLPALEDYDGETTVSCDSPPDPVCAMKPDSGTAVGNCSTAEMIAHDIYEVSCLSGVDTLPEATIDIVKGTSPNSGITRYNIEIAWQTRNKDDSGNVITEKLTMNVIPGSDSGL